MAKFRKNKTKKVASEANGSEMNGVDVEESSESHQKTQKPVKPRKDSDVDEGKTIFVRNLSFETTQEALRLFMTNIGPVEYCLLCKDKEVDQSKGSGFVKFKRVEDADHVVSMDQDQLLLDGRKLKVDYALARNVVQKKDSKDRDKRNLYLAREGVIYAGSPGAEGVSKQDLEKRLALEGKKRLLLQKLTNFVSKTRLCVHNVPPDIDNARLKKLFLDSVPNSGAKIVECRIMRNRSATGKLGSNKGFAFVEFEKHEHALKSLRKLNNNPHVFMDTRRPIVEFAVEDKLALNKRMRQRAKNELAKKNDLEKRKKDVEKRKEDVGKRKEDVGKRKEDVGKRKENEGKKRGEKTMEEKFSSSSNATKIVKSVDKSQDESENDSEGKVGKGKSEKEVSEPRVRNKREKKDKKKKKESEQVRNVKDDNENYSGFIAEPLKASEPVVAPKLNRKLGEAKKLIAEKVRQKKFEEKKEKTKKEHLSRRQLKIARRKEAKALESKKKIPKEFDDFEEHFVKKTGAKILVDDRHDGVDIPTKKAKWFRDD